MPKVQITDHSTGSIFYTWGLATSRLASQKKATQKN